MISVERFWIFPYEHFDLILFFLGTILPRVRTAIMSKRNSLQTPYSPNAFNIFAPAVPRDSHAMYTEVAGLLTAPPLIQRPAGSKKQQRWSTMSAVVPDSRRKRWSVVSNQTTIYAPSITPQEWYINTDTTQEGARLPESIPQPPRAHTPHQVPVTHPFSFARLKKRCQKWLSKRSRWIITGALSWIEV